MMQRVAYSTGELRSAVRVERMKLTVELRTLTRRVREVEERLRDLELADNLLDGRD